MSVHKNLTGADLHEPKGADTALTGQVYVANGSGGGVWTDATSVVTNTAFTTGDLKITHKTTADTSWILWQEGTIGDGSSSASLRANADTSSLFNLYWSYSATDCPIYTSAGVLSTRGASAAVDFAAHKRISLPLGNARMLMIAGVATGLTSRSIGNAVGSETVTLARANLPNTTVTVSVVDPGHTHTFTGTGVTSYRVYSAGTGAVASIQFQNGTDGSVILTTNTTGITASFNLNGGVTQTAVGIIPPATGVNVMIKL